MAPPVSFTKVTLSYPLYAADFDPYNRGYLVVGGGGGEGRSGVSNKLTLLDVSDRSKLITAAEIDLSRDEDSVTSLANLASKDGLVTFAGINSSEADQQRGLNEHLRSFEIHYPPRRKSSPNSETSEKSKNEDEGRISLLSKTALFRPSSNPRTNPQYQRTLRLSQRFGSAAGPRKRIGAVATGLAPQAEIVSFAATTSTPGAADVISRINPPKGVEAADVDIIESEEEGDFALVYCTDYDVYLQSVSYDFGSKTPRATPEEPRPIHSVPYPDSSEKPSRPKCRALRWLTPEYILLLSNLPNRTGAELSILPVYPKGPGSVLLRKILPKHVKQAIGLDACVLDADSAGSRQIVVAVAGQDVSISVFTINYAGTSNTLGKFKSFSTLRDVHPLQMTKICFSPDTPAPLPSIPSHPLPQYIRLASVSMGNTVVVDTFALTPLDPKQRGTRYVLSHPRAERLQLGLGVAITAFILIVGAVLLQSYLELSGGTEARSVSRFLPPGARQFLGERAYVLENKVAESVDHVLPEAITGRLRALVAQNRHHHHHVDTRAAHEKAIIVRNGADDATLAIDTYHPSDPACEHLEHSPAKSWEQLEPHQRETWKRRLLDAGEWAAEEGETVLKGVLFSEWAGFVGAAAAEVIQEL
ncbi:hypothetical protein BJ546DRAFT_892023 [Cryomyces antarcticus]